MIISAVLIFLFILLCFRISDLFHSYKQNKARKRLGVDKRLGIFCDFTNIYLCQTHCGCNIFRDKGKGRGRDPVFYYSHSNELGLFKWSNSIEKARTHCEIACEVDAILKDLKQELLNL